MSVATVDECTAALTTLADRLDGTPQDARRRSDRTLSLQLTDLGTEFRARVSNGRLLDVTGPQPQEPDTVQGRAQIRLRCGSDDLIALVRGELDALSAWTGGRLRVDASPLDLLRLKSLF